MTTRMWLRIWMNTVQANNDLTIGCLQFNKTFCDVCDALTTQIHEVAVLLIKIPSSSLPKKVAFSFFFVFPMYNWYTRFARKWRNVYSRVWKKNPFRMISCKIHLERSNSSWWTIPIPITGQTNPVGSRVRVDSERTRKPSWKSQESLRIPNFPTNGIIAPHSQVLHHLSKTVGSIEFGVQKNPRSSSRERLLLASPNYARDTSSRKLQGQMDATTVKFLCKSGRNGETCLRHCRLHAISK